MRWGEQLEFTAEAGPGDFIFVTALRAALQEINASPDEPLECVLVRSGNEAVVVNLDIAASRARPEQVFSLDRSDPQADRSRSAGPAGSGCLDPREGGV